MSDLFGDSEEKFKPIWRKRYSPNKDYFTPPYIIRELGPFDLDPCANEKQPFATARRQYTLKENGLTSKWSGRIWLNPPHGELVAWMSRMVEHGNGIAMIFATVETRVFFDYVWDNADAVFFIRRRVKFVKRDGTVSRSNCSSPSCLVAYGMSNVDRLKRSKLEGRLVTL